MSEEKAQEPLPTDQFPLILTGQRRTEGKRRQVHFAFLRGIRVSLANAPFVLLAQLTRARIETHSGYLRFPPEEDSKYFNLRIFRLRHAIHDSSTRGDGREVIQTGVGTEYRLTVEEREIAIDPSFKELPWQLIPTDLRDFLVEHCPEKEVPDELDTEMKAS